LQKEGDVAIMGRRQSQHPLLEIVAVIA
jgi:hypothetical protein